MRVNRPMAKLLPLLSALRARWPVLVVVAATIGAGAGLWRWRRAAPAPEVRTAATPVRAADHGVEFLGVQACRECHGQRVEEYCQTSHFSAMRAPTADSILGSFAPGQNRVATRERTLHYELTAEEDGFYQAAVRTTPAGDERVRERIDLVMGSGKIAQSFFYWRGDQLFQLPIGYNTPFRGWANNPGFPDGRPRFDRAIDPRCLECHATYFQHVWGTDNRYVKDRMLLEISCERCHGPGAEHVAAHRRDEALAEPQHIVRPQGLPRERQLEVCGQCHSDPGVPVKPSFTYRPGEPLADYIDLTRNRNAHNTLNSVGVADQLTPLRQSQCFQNSEMTCVSCHNPHRHERGQIADFSRRCQACHQPEHCGMFASLGERLADDCIHCHMPRTGDDQTLWETARSDGLVLIENYNHRVGVYREATDRQLFRLWKEDADPQQRAEVSRLMTGIAQASAARARERLASKLPGQAEQIVRDGLTVAPEDAALWHLLGQALAAMAKPAEAVPAYQRSVELDTESPEPYLDLAAAQNALDRPDEALATYRAVCRVAPDHRQAQLNLVWMLACDPFPRIRNAAEALRLMDSIVAQYGEEDGDILDAWGAALAESGAWERAAQLAARARALAEVQGNASWAEAIGQRRELYQQQRPYRRRGVE